MNAHNPVAALRAENDELRERVRQLEETLTDRSVLPHEWKLSAKQTIVVNMLMARAIVPASALQTALGDIEYDCVKMHVCMTRQKLAPHGVFITTAVGQGWYLTNDMKEKVRGAR